VANSPASYLQTLPKGEAIAFVASLLKVKTHLDDELQWMNVQLQQKTSQLQGIEAILSEAVLLGLIDAEATPSTPNPDANRITISLPSNLISIAPQSIELTDSINLGITNSAVLASSASVAASEPSAPPTIQPKSTQPRKPKTNKKASSKKQSNTKTSNTKTKKSNVSTEASDLRQFLQAEFREQTLVESIAQVLEDAPEPLGADDIMAELYEDLSDEDYRRAKRSLTNILSLGKTRGKWQSAARGLYRGNA
jgi:hypothetical protein